MQHADASTTRAGAAAGVKKAVEFPAAVAHLAPTEYAVAEVAYKLILHDGTEFVGLLNSQSPEEISFQRIPPENPANSGRIVLTFKRTAIAALLPVTLAERQRQFRKLLADLEAQSGLEAATRAGDFYDLAALACRLGLKREAHGYLERAFALAPEGRLADVFRQEVIHRAIQRAALFAAGNRKQYAEDALRDLERALPDYPPAREETARFRTEVLAKVREGAGSTLTFQVRDLASAKPAPAPAPKVEKTARQLSQAADGGREVEVVVDSGTVASRNAEAAKFIEQGNGKFSEAMTHYEQFLKGARGAAGNRALEQAGALFEQAVDLYGKALELDKNNRAVLGRQEEANRLLYGCKKHHTR